MIKLIQAFLISSILGSFFYLIIGWLLFDCILGSYTDAHTTKILGFKKLADFSFLFLYLSCLSYSSLISFILLNATIASFGKAILFTSSIGFLVACMTDFFWYASSHFYTNFTVICLDIASAAIAVGALGGFTFLVVSKFKKT